MAEEDASLAAETYFSTDEIAGPLRSHFMQLPKGSDGSTTIECVCQIPEVSMYPLLRRVLKMKSNDSDDRVTFATFVRSMSVLSGRASTAEKIRDAFEIYNLREDGVVEKHEMFNIFRLVTGRQHSDQSLWQIVDSFLARYNGALTARDFKQMFVVSDASKMLLNS
uniref:EF-hand domain-containing protein n=1 Tax=Chrysotila carterae TaxID=13221 RepID=A0A7S4C3A7_CHRCT|eukprot:6209390-Pleurochrysis_carterae.AAC.2